MPTLEHEMVAPLLKATLQQSSSKTSKKISQPVFLQQTYSRSSKENTQPVFSAIVSKHILTFMKTYLFIIRKLNAAANMFASTKGATEVIAAVLQQTYSKTSKKTSQPLFSEAAGEKMILLFLDWEKAFDKVDQHELLNAMSHEPAPVDAPFPITHPSFPIIHCGLQRHNIWPVASRNVTARPPEWPVTT